MLPPSLLALAPALFAGLITAHDSHAHDQEPIAGPHKSLWYNALPGDGGTQADSVFSGISTFGRLPYFPCLASDEEKYDIAFLGAPFDTGTSYRPGARFGPSGIRQGAYASLACGKHRLTQSAVQRRLQRALGHEPVQQLGAGAGLRGYSGDVVGLSLCSLACSLGKGIGGGRARGGCSADLIGWGGGYRYDNAYAIKQIEEGHHALLTRKPSTNANKPGPAKNGKTLPRIITLGGDHTITLPLLRSINRAYGPISVIHFDSHLDTWKPAVFGGAPTHQASINHGTYFYHAHAEGLLANDSNIHAGIRTTLSGLSDYANDGYCGFEIVEAREIDSIGMHGIVKKIKERVGVKDPVYLSIDIDTLDPAFAPATGTPETGGWSTRELRTIIRGLEGINLIAADIVEVAPAYDTNAEHTTMAAADVLFEVMSLMVKRGSLDKMVGGGEGEGEGAEM
ncbi:hypothetical protein MMC08_005599 [Hypocenomyce scalaris]|nr:hypothetical protein [Hypocenomyce scalaris]